MQNDVERRVAEAVSAPKLMRYTTEISRWVRSSGSEEEARAFDYLEETLNGFGLAVQRHTHDALISWPGEASLEVLGSSGATMRCITHSFAASTAPGGLEAEVVDAGGGDGTRDAQGKVLLIDGLAMPGPARLAQHTGALGLIFVNPEHFYESIVSTVWGSPTPETVSTLPTVVVVSVTDSDATLLRTMAKNGTLRVRIRAAVDTRWRKTPVLTADLAAPASDRFVLFSGHVDSWHHGAMDNASANAIMVEMARVFSRYQKRLRRGIRFAFWSGHSHGRYSGSAWYADNHWEELYHRAVLHLNTDSPGGKGAALLNDAPTMAETWALAARSIQDVTGQELRRRRIRHNADQSFWGIGLPSMFAALSTQPVEDARAGPLADAGGAAMHLRSGWWWHTTGDTIDKIDAANLRRDAQVYALVLWRWCTSSVLPLDYRETVAELREVLDSLHTAAGAAFDLVPALVAAERLAAATDRLTAAITRVQAIAGRSTRKQRVAQAAINDSLMRLGRALIPVTYTAAGPFDHDPAMAIPLIPGLQPASRIAALPADGDDRHALHVRLVRERNRLVHALTVAIDVIDQGVERT